MAKIIPALLILLVGLVLALHFSMNAAVGKFVSNARMGNAVFWIIGACMAVAVGLSGWDAEFFTKAREVPRYLWLAGAMGALIVFAVAAAIPRLGAATTNIALLTGQVLGGMLIAHYGLLGSPVEKLNLARVVGGLLTLAGATLVVLGRFPFRS